MVHHSLDYKLSAIKYYKKVNNYVEVCKVFDCNRTSLMRWVKLYDQNKLHSNHNKTRKSYKITEEQVKYIRKIIYQRNKLLTTLLINHMHMSPLLYCYENFFLLHRPEFKMKQNVPKKLGNFNFR
jgi:transposase-like protein